MEEGVGPSSDFEEGARRLGAVVGAGEGGGVLVLALKLWKLHQLGWGPWWEASLHWKYLKFFGFLRV